MPGTRVSFYVGRGSGATVIGAYLTSYFTDVGPIRARPLLLGALYLIFTALTLLI